MQAILIAIGAKLGQWLMENLGAFGLKTAKKALKNRKIDKEVNTEVQAVRQALDDIGQVENSMLKDGRLPLEKEQKLRQASRTLRRNLLG